MIDLYNWHTSNGRKLFIMLEELAVDYNTHAINIGKDDQFTPEFTAINPNGKIPAMIDQDGPGGEPFALLDYSIADMAIYPWTARYDWQGVALEEFPNVKRWFETVGARPAVEKAMGINLADAA
jgi:glutathione S-transferase